VYEHIVKQAILNRFIHAIGVTENGNDQIEKDYNIDEQEDDVIHSSYHLDTLNYMPIISLFIVDFKIPTTECWFKVNKTYLIQAMEAFEFTKRQ